MATLIKTDGSKLEIQPQNGLDFQLDELQKFVDGYIDIINLHNGDILVITLIKLVLYVVTPLM